MTTFSKPNSQKENKSPTANSIPLSFWDFDGNNERQNSISIVLPIPEETTDSISFSNLAALNTIIDYDPTTRRENDKNNRSVGSYGTVGIYRAPSNGTMTFKANTEYDLLNHVQNGIGEYILSNKYSDVEAATAILKSIDLYCLGKQWMYHVGHEKGKIIKEFLCQCVTTSTNSSTNDSSSIASTTQQQPGGEQSKEQDHPSKKQKQPFFTIVELGTYCGYSAILLAKTVREFMPDLNFHLYSTETDKENIQIATKMIKMAKLENYVTLLALEDSSTSSLMRALKQKNLSSQIDFLFLDHEKELYLNDLKALEISGHIQKGTYVAADNVIYYDILEKYRKYMDNLAKQSFVETTVHEINLEYSNSDHKDGIEFTVYLKDPHQNIKNGDK